jgi:hypothetical protein
VTPAWTTDWITDSGRERLRAYGIAPPEGSTSKRSLLGESPVIRCPQCGSAHRSAQRVRLHGVQGAVPLRRLPGTVRLFQVHLSGVGRPSWRTTMSKFHSLTIKEVRTETRDAVSIAFDIPQHLQDSFHFTQGQHLVMRTHLDGEEVRRSYSICTGVNDGELRVAIKRVAGGRFSAFANEQLKAGHSLEVMPPAGIFSSNSTRRATATTWRSRPAAASRRSCRSSRPPWKPSRTAASPCCTATVPAPAPVSRTA